jgi:hypothetical protein
MKNGLIGLLSAMVLASTMATAACSDSNSSGGTGGTASTTGGSSSSGGNAPSTGGQQSTGGSATGGSATGGAATGSGGAATGGSSNNCSNVTPCGGNVVGTWSVTSSCLTVTGQVDMSSLGIGCTSASVTGSLQVTGTWTANSDGTYSDNTTTSGDEQLTLPAACLTVSGTTTTCDALSRSALPSLGYASGTCTDAAGGGCNCSAHVQQTGGIGVLNLMATTNADYTTSGNTLTTSQSGRYNTPYSYCVSGSSLTMTPQPTSPTTTGTIVLQKQ